LTESGLARIGVTRFEISRAPSSWGKALRSIPDVCEVRLVRSQRAESDIPPALLIEVPHGATSARHFEAIRRRLVSRLPENLREFFFVNTDVGAFECAERMARMIVDPDAETRLPPLLGDAASQIAGLAPRSVLIVRSLVPRTFVDCNRVLTPDGANSEMTTGVPDYIRNTDDIATLRALHEAYQEVATSGYRRICGAGGMAIQLHSYAPREVQVDRVDDDIVAVLRRAYEPDNYERWNRRPDVDIISCDVDGKFLAPQKLAGTIRECFARVGIAAAENTTYRLHPSTTGYLHSTAYPGQVLCVEINRDRLGDPFTPFAETTIGAGKLTEMSAPLAAGSLIEWATVAD
jgi:hypothetical protein